jgi:hypothetical protein
MDKKVDDLVIPWAFAVKLLRVHLIAALLRKGHGVVEIQKMLDDSLKDRPDEELRELAQELLTKAGVVYSRTSPPASTDQVLRRIGIDPESKD